jgi:hypothetical protein
MRVSSTPWEEVARAVDSCSEVCGRWPRKYPEECARFCAEAQKRYEETNRDTLETIPKLLRSDNPKVRRKAERMVAEFRRRFPEVLGHEDETGTGP